MKGRAYGEYQSAKQFLPNLTVHLVGLDSFVMRDNPAPVDIKMAKEGFLLAKEVMGSGDYDMVILDEINVAVDFKLIDLKDVLDLIKTRPPGLDVILTGRYAHPEIMALADTVTEMKEIKHHYAAGVKDRPGIEY
jgi:cob(I)alamin adenosyltransferase